ncbi:TPR-like protein, partial [Ramicandelaber brevisporus]
MLVRTVSGGRGDACQAFLEALRLDPRLFEAAEYLNTLHLLTPAQQLSDVFTISQNSLGLEEFELEFLRCIHAIWLPGSALPPAILRDAVFKLSSEYGLGEHPLVIKRQAELAAAYGHLSSALDLVSQQLDVDHYDIDLLFFYVTCLTNMGNSVELFRIAHGLLEHFSPSDGSFFTCLPWYAIGCYYSTIGQQVSARRYFAKAALLDPYCAQAWIGFAHTYAAEQHLRQQISSIHADEPAIAAYSTAHRMLPGSHLPLLYSAMQHLRLGGKGSVRIAKEQFNDAGNQLYVDPLLLNEIGVLYLRLNDLERARTILEEAVHLFAVGAQQ